MIVRRITGLSHNDSTLLRHGQDYVVYGISIDIPPEFLIFEPETFSFPFFVSSEVVEVLDHGIPGSWKYSPSLTSTEVYTSSRLLKKA